MMMIVGLFNDATSYYGHTASERLNGQECDRKQDDQRETEWIKNEQTQRRFVNELLYVLDQRFK